ncbi:MAG: YraN family protein, partial [Steroidobacteraceae bacterium]
MEGTRTWRHRTGLQAENAAAAYLRSQGAQILLRNYRCRCGELDIVARLGA